jgi:hypothetical protein
MEFAQTHKCPRCKLPQTGALRCQYCGYLLSKEKKYKRTIRSGLASILGVFNKDRIFTAKVPKIKDNGGTRTGSDRRKHWIVNYFPEKRSVSDRRKGFDRRSQAVKRRLSERRYCLKHGQPYPRKLKPLS